ncbi:MAG: hypothetical protein U9N57_03920 [Pseudomonadota bacterium]|nr:hypothetical protein [Pseudomonadota bacterium]
MNLEKTKLYLLSYSKNMLIAAQQSNWEKFLELDSEWLQILQAKNDEYGEELSSINSELLNDNLLIQELIKLEQKSIVEVFEQQNKNKSSIKSYLK